MLAEVAAGFEKIAADPGALSAYRAESEELGNALHLKIRVPESGLKEDGFAMPEQLRAISHDRLSRRLGRLRLKNLEELLKRCRVLLR